MDKERNNKNRISKILFFGFLLSIAGIVIAFIGPLVGGFSAARGGVLPADLIINLTHKLLYIAVICFLVFGVALTVNTVRRILTFALKGERLNFHEIGGGVMALVFLYIAFYALRPETFAYLLGELSR